MRACTTLVAAAVAVVAQQPPPSAYNVEWTSPTPEPGMSSDKRPTYQGAMPLGNGDLTALIWANVSAGGIQFSLSSSRSMSSYTELFKMGMTQVLLSPNPFTSSSLFNQTMDAATATVWLSMGGTAATPAATIAAYIDANANVLTLDISSPAGTSYNVTVNTFSVRPAQFTNHTVVWECSMGWNDPDVLLGAVPSGAGFQTGTAVIYHRNNLTSEGSFVQELLTAQGVPQLVNTVNDVWINNTFGYAVDSGNGPALQRVSPATLRSVIPSTAFTVRVTALANQTATPDAWVAQLGAVVAGLQPDASRRTAHTAWWSAFWQRSYVALNATQWSTAAGATAFMMSQQYALTRYQQAIQSRNTDFPIKFNGQMFVATMPEEGTLNADYRDWGAANWWQNTRLSYWSMLATGDADTFETILRYFTNIMPFAAARAQAYFNHTGIFYIETQTVFGSFTGQDYGCQRPQGYPVWLADNDYIHLDYGGDGGTPEVGMMALEHFMHTQDEAALATYLPLATLAIDFFAQHYPNRTTDGQLVIWPTQSGETNWCSWDVTTNQPDSNCCVNDLPTVAGVRALLAKLLALPPQFTTPEQRAQWTAFQSILPPLPIADGKLVGAEVLSSGIHNDETMELYAVHPYRLFTKALNLTAGVDLTPAIAAFNGDKNAASNEGWNQGILDAALLGMTGAAASMLIQRGTTAPAPGYRYQGFMPHMQDYEPSANHLANYLSGFNWMLLQPVDDGTEFTEGKMVVFPAWPCNWDVSFKLWGPLNTSVEVVYAGGALVNMTVTPASRAAAVTFANCVSA